MSSLYTPNPVALWLPAVLASLALIIMVALGIHRWRRSREERRHKIVPINPGKMGEIKNDLETRSSDEKRIGHCVRLTATDGTIVTLMNTHSIRIDALKKAVNHAIENDAHTTTDLSYQVETDRWKAFKKKLTKETEQEETGRDNEQRG